MNAIRVSRFGAPEVMKLAAVPDPEPGAGQVVVRIEAAGVNPVDTYIRAGQYARLPVLPYTPGMDGAGVIAAVGANVPGLKPGQRVYVAGSLSGTYASCALCEAGQVHLLPDRVTAAQGAALGIPYATAHFALFSRGGAQPGENVLIHGGTGGVGLAAIQFARAAGLTVFATGGTEAGRRLALENGAHEVFDHSEPGVGDRILAATSGRGVDLIVELLANVNLGRDLTLLAAHGRVVIVGSRGAVEINPRDAMARNADIRGCMLTVAPAPDVARAHAAIRAGLENGTLRPVIGREFPLASAPEAHAAVLGPGASGKIVLIP